MLPRSKHRMHPCTFWSECMTHFIIKDKKLDLVLSTTTIWSKVLPQRWTTFWAIHPKCYKESLHTDNCFSSRFRVCRIRDVNICSQVYIFIVLMYFRSSPIICTLSPQNLKTWILWFLYSPKLSKRTGNIGSLTDKNRCSTIGYFIPHTCYKPHCLIWLTAISILLLCSSTL